MADSIIKSVMNFMCTQIQDNCTQIEECYRGIRDDSKHTCWAFLAHEGAEVVGIEINTQESEKWKLSVVVRSRNDESVNKAIDTIKLLWQKLGNQLFIDLQDNCTSEYDIENIQLQDVAYATHAEDSDDYIGYVSYIMDLNFNYV